MALCIASVLNIVHANHVLCWLNVVVLLLFNICNVVGIVFMLTSLSWLSVVYARVNQKMASVFVFVPHMCSIWRCWMISHRAVALIIIPCLKSDLSIVACAHSLNCALSTSSRTNIIIWNIIVWKHTNAYNRMLFPICTCVQHILLVECLMWTRSHAFVDYLIIVSCPINVHLGIIGWY